jgi:hypothetical protein
MRPRPLAMRRELRAMHPGCQVAPGVRVLLPGHHLLQRHLPELEAESVGKPMPSCRSCNPTCQRCHRKPGFRLPIECPVCGRYNPAHWEVCKRCGTAIVQPEPGNARTHLSTDTRKSCFRCDPLKQPLCRTCMELGRIKLCPVCSGYVLGTRKDCKACGYVFKE